MLPSFKLFFALVLLTLCACSGSSAPEAPAASSCFEAGQHLGQCSDPRSLWVGCDAPPAAANCAPSGFEGQYCCDAAPAPALSCTDSYSPALCGENVLYEYCSTERELPAGCTPTNGDTHQTLGHAWCCPVEFSQVPKGPTGHAQ